jgi:hypothetical protein
VSCCVDGDKKQHGEMARPHDFAVEELDLKAVEDLTVDSTTRA